MNRMTCLALLDELVKIAEGSPIGQLVNSDKEQGSTDGAGGAPKKQSLPSPQLEVEGTAPAPEDFSSALQDSTDGGSKG